MSAEDKRYSFLQSGDSNRVWRTFGKYSMLGPVLTTCLRIPNETFTEGDLEDYILTACPSLESTLDKEFRLCKKNLVDILLEAGAIKEVK